MSEQVSKAQRRTITIGKIPLEVAMLPNGSYVFSQSEVARVVERPEISIRRFSRSEWLKSLVGLHSKPDPLPTEGANRPIAPVSPEVAALYWQKCASQGNQKAQALVVAIIKRSLYDFADEAFGVKRGSSGGADADADDLLSEELVQIETMYQSLSYQECGAAASDIEQLNLKIRLAELELERERLQHSKEHNVFPAADINKLGVPPWKVLLWTQKTLGWADNNATSKLLSRFGYNFKSEPWFQVRVVGNLWLLPWPSFEALTKAVLELKSESHQPKA